jgi:hypothetical protein
MTNTRPNDRLLMLINGHGLADHGLEGAVALGGHKGAFQSYCTYPNEYYEISAVAGSASR